LLSDLAIKYVGVDVYDVYPKKLPDLFYGSQLVILGRYKDSGEGKVTLTGNVGEKKEQYMFASNFAEKTKENNFIAPLWAKRKVAYLLDDIRMNGENKEVVEEIVELAKKYGIVTPYTSYLVTEDESVARNQRPTMPLQRGQFDQTQSGAGAYNMAPGEAREKAVTQSRELKKMKEETTVERDKDEIVRHVAGKTFVKKNDVWVDNEYSEKKYPKPIEITFGSDEYFELMTEHSEMAEYLSVGEKVIVVYEGKCYRVR
jgi:Ca-activated chloride channel family protein